MAAEKGNKYWQLKEKHGRDKIFKSAEDLWRSACEYFKWIDENPFQKLDFKGSLIQEVVYPIPKPYTESGLCVFLGIGVSTWTDYCSGKEKYKAYSAVTKTIKEIIKTQKFEGAASGFFNSNIIARDLGLVDKTDNENSGEMIIRVLRGEDGGNDKTD